MKTYSIQQVLRMDIQYLYKYRTFNDSTERIILYDEVYVPSPLEFNDPFDCRVPVIAEGSEEDFKNLIIEEFRSKAPTLSEQEIKKLAEAKLGDGTHKDKTKIQQALESAIVNQLKNIGVDCLSAKNDDILMWSHYADGHKGFCLEFEGSDYKTFLKRANKVNYQKELPIINYFDKNCLPKILLTKSEQWRYEEEWRIIQVNGPGKYGIPEGVLSGVIFGCQMPQEHKNKIINWSKGRKVPVRFYQAQIKKREFGLNIIRLTNL